MPRYLIGAAGIGPAYAAYKTAALPLDEAPLKVQALLFGSCTRTADRRGICSRLRLGTLCGLSTKKLYQYTTVQGENLPSGSVVPVYVGSLW